MKLINRSGQVIYEDSEKNIKDTLKNALKKGANLKNISLQRQLLDGLVLEKADLRNADFSGSSLYGAVLDGSVLDHALFLNVKADGVSFVNSRLVDAKFLGQFNNSFFENANLAHADLTGSSFKNSNFKHVKLNYATLKEVNFFQTNLTGAILDYATVAGSNFFKAKLSKDQLEELVKRMGVKVIDYKISKEDIEKIRPMFQKGVNQ